MKKTLLSLFAAGTLAFSLGACSSTNTDTTTGATSEVVTTNDPESQVRAGETGVANQMNEDATAAASAAATMDTTNFAIVAASSDAFEMLSSQMAKSKGTHAEVKRFAEQMLTEHSKTTVELKALAARKNLTLPGAPLPMHQRMLLPLTEASAGKQFDERYMEAQVKAHQRAVTLFETAAKNETDADLRAFATQTLPMLRMHLDLAKKTEELVD